MRNIKPLEHPRALGRTRPTGFLAERLFDALEDGGHLRVVVDAAVRGPGVKPAPDFRVEELDRSGP